MNNEVSRSEFARKNGWAPSYVTKLADHGRLVLTPDGRRVLVRESMARIEETRGGRGDVSARHAKGRRPAAGVAPESSAPGTPPPDDGAAAVAPSLPTEPVRGGGGGSRFKAATMHYENQLTRLEMSLARGSRLFVRDVKAEARALGAAHRAAVERMIDQVAARLSVAPNQEERRRLLMREVQKMRLAIGAQFPRALRRLREAARSESK